jgi:hypothetical protein
MPRDLRLIHSQSFDQKTNTDFIVAHKVEQSQPGPVSQGAKEKRSIEHLPILSSHSSNLACFYRYVLTYVFADYIRLSKCEEAVGYGKHEAKDPLSLHR